VGLRLVLAEALVDAGVGVVLVVVVDVVVVVERRRE